MKLGLLEDLLGLMGSGTIAGMPTIIVMAIPFIVGLIIGFLVKKLLKIAIIAGIIVVIASYLGFFSLSLDALKNVATQYGPIVFHYGALLMGMLPLGLGLAVDLIVGFIFG